MDAASLIAELEPTVERLLERHLAGAKEWFPHELVPWSRGRDFVPGEAWDPDEVRPRPAVRSALLVNLLTEDNLPVLHEHDHVAVRQRRTRGARGCGVGPPKRGGTRSCCATT